MALRDGQVAETGTHDELMKEKGLYHSLFTAQLSDKDMEISSIPGSRFWHLVVNVKI